MMTAPNSPSIYISHAWGGESEEIVQGIVKRFQKENIPVILDKKDLGYRQSISQFMKNLGRADAIIIVVSNKYLHSEYCMYELLQIYNSDNIYQRIFPVVLDEVKIAKSTERLDLVKYWEHQTIELEEKIRALQSLSNIEGITEDLNLYHNIRSKIAKLTGILKDINTLNITLHKDSDYQALVNAVKNKLFENKTTKFDTAHSIQTEVPVVSHPINKKNKPFKGLLWLIGLISIILLSWFTINNFLLKDKKSLNKEEILMQPIDTVKNETTDIAEEVSRRPTLNDVDKTEIPKNNTEQTDIPESIKKNENKSFKNVISEVENENDTLKKNIEETIIPPENEENLTEKKEPIEEIISVTIPEQIISGVFKKDISSDQNEKDDFVYLSMNEDLLVDQNKIISKGADIRGRITRINSSKNGGRAVLAIKLEQVQAVNGNWLDVHYPELSDKSRNEIIFQKGMEINKIKLKSTTTQVQKTK